MAKAKQVHSVITLRDNFIEDMKSFTRRGDAQRHMRDLIIETVTEPMKKKEAAQFVKGGFITFSNGVGIHIVSHDVKPAPWRIG